MEFRKINYLTLIYHFFSFNYTLGMYSKFNNEIFFKKAKMNVFFPLFTALNNLEGRPLHLKKRPFALYYYSLFCRDNLRETFLPFKFKNKSGLFTIMFRYANRSNFLFKKRVKKKNFFFCTKNTNVNSKNNVLLLSVFLVFLSKVNVIFDKKNLTSNYFNIKLDVVKKKFAKKIDEIFTNENKKRNILLYRKKIVTFKGNSRNRNYKNLKKNFYINIYKYKNIKKNYVYSKLKK